MSKCPVDHQQIINTLAKMNKIFELPWTPIYTQSGALAGDDAGGAAAAPNTDDMSPLAYWSLAATIIFTIVVYCFEGNLDARQRASYLKTTFPKQLEATVAKIDADRASKPKKKVESKKSDDGKEGEKKKNIDDTKPLLEQLQNKFKNSQAYGLDKINFGMFSATYDTIESVAFLLLGFFPYIWDQSVMIGETWFGWTNDDEIKVTLVFVFLITIVGTITSLPFELYSTFMIEKKHGFNKQTMGLFFSDKAKSLVLTCVIGGPFISLLLKIIKVRYRKTYLPQHVPSTI